MTDVADMESSGMSRSELVGRLLDVVAAGTVGPGGVLTVGPDALPLIAALTTSVSGTCPLDELMFEAGSWIGSREAAARMGCSDRWVRYLARRNAIRSQQVDGRWLLWSGAVEQWAATAQHTPDTGTPPPPEA
jgi:hypothetical protein